LISFDINANVLALRDEVERLPGAIRQPFTDGLPPLPRELVDLYSEALAKGAPYAFNGLGNFPLREGLDALISAFDQSTAKINPSSTALDLWPPTVEEINNLLKARFIFDCMIKSRWLRDAGRDSPWAFALSNMLKKLQAEYRQWHRHLDNNIPSVASLNPESFQIWVVAETSAARLATEPDETQGEEKILEVALADWTNQVSKSLVVFRRPSNELRLLTFTSSNPSSVGEISSHEVEKIVNLHKVEVVPRYARPARVTTPLIMELCFPGASSGYTYRFMARDDLKKFQQALLGYKINFEDFCRWTTHSSSVFGGGGKLKGEGFVQILQPKPLPAIKPMDGDFVAPTSPLQGLSRVQTDSLFSVQDSIAPSTITPSMRRLSRASTLYVQESREAFIAAHPPSPVLLILTEIEGRPTFLHLRCKSPALFSME
jgi:hypothetical protein